MGAAWRELGNKKKAFREILEMVSRVNAEGLEVCATLGMLNPEQAKQLKEAGLHAYNHNLDTSREFYPSVIKTRTYDDRLDTIQNVKEAGISVCSGRSRRPFNTPSRGAAAPSRHRCASSPGEEVVGGLVFDFEAIRTPRESARWRQSTAS